MEEAEAEDECGGGIGWVNDGDEELSVEKECKRRFFCRPNIRTRVGFFLILF
ncbi:MAG: hypothetical protein K2X97_00775 [Mycobacteriaceae bacterium]|nr:hypothetical protein [Mycobacteriaceae bacterium]